MAHSRPDGVKHLSMSTTETNRLLLLVESQNEAERLISLFRNSGHATRAHRITSEQDLLEHLDDMEWHLLLSDDKHASLGFREAGELIIKSHHDIPALLLVEQADSQSIIEGFNKGAEDVIQADADQHLMFAAQREIHNVRERIARGKVQAALEETTQRAELLLSESQDAIAYVSDGMHIEANEAYAEIFGYKDNEELECMPIIDLVAETDHERFKTVLRHFGSEEGEQSAEISFTAAKEDGTQFAAYMTLSISSFEGEPCTQVSIHTQDGATPGTGMATQEPITGLPTRGYLEDQLSTAALQVSKGSGTANLLYINIDDFDHLRTQLGIKGSDQIIKNLTEMINHDIGGGDCLARFGDSSLAMLLCGKTAQEALEYATHWCKLVEDHICEVLEQTVQYTCTIGIASLGSRNIDEVIDQAFAAVKQVYERQEKNCAEIFIPISKPTAKETSSSTASLEDAIEQDRFRLLFQPIISLRGDSREHYEVSLRMLDDDDQEIPPLEFLQHANDTKLDRWVILEATKMLSLHRAEGRDTRVIINLTGNALEDASLIPWIGVAIKAANLPANSIIFQFTEEDIAQHLNAAKEVTKTISDLDIKISVGGFGKSLDPAKTLKHVTVHYVKIDGSFTLALQEHQGDPQVLKALVNTINENGMISIVPCVENAGVLATLWQLGVNYIQGHYLQPPSPSMDYEFTEIA